MNRAVLVVVSRVVHGRDRPPHHGSASGCVGQTGCCHLSIFKQRKLMLNSTPSTSACFQLEGNGDNNGMVVVN